MFSDSNIFRDLPLGGLFITCVVEKGKVPTSVWVALFWKLFWKLVGYSQKWCCNCKFFYTFLYLLAVLNSKIKKLPFLSTLLLGQCPSKIFWFQTEWKAFERMSSRFLILFPYFSFFFLVSDLVIPPFVSLYCLQDKGELDVFDWFCENNSREYDTAEKFPCCEAMGRLKLSGEGGWTFRGSEG